MIAKDLSLITPFKIKLVKISVHKKGALNSKVELDCDVEEAKGKSVILIDDVLHTGKTFILGMKPFLEVDVKKIQVAVLINRCYAMFPIQSNYTGYSLSTTLNEHIDVKLEPKGFGFYIY